MNNRYRYILQQYKGVSSRQTCPYCGHPHEFALYIDTVTGQPVHPLCGRCNRVEKCGAHVTPAEFFKDNPDAKPEDEWKPSFITVLKDVPKHKTEFLPSKFIPTVNQIEKNNLFKFFCSKFGEAKSREVFERYKVGTSKHWCNNDGLSAVFPQIETTGRLRQIKVIAYNPITGKRLHKEHPAEKMTSKGYIMDTQQDKVWFAGKSLLGNYEANLTQCFFGEHLLHSGNDIAIVESEKTAMIASLYMPNIIWLATGGKNGCKWTSRDVSKVLQGKRVILYPDLKCLSDWIQNAETLKSYGLDVKVSKWLEEHASDADKALGLDIGDYLIKEPLPKPTVKMVCEIKPPLKPPAMAKSSYAQDGSIRTIGDLFQCLHELGIPKSRIKTDFSNGKSEVVVLSKQNI